VLVCSIALYRFIDLWQGQFAIRRRNDVILTRPIRQNEDRPIHLNRPIVLPLRCPDVVEEPFIFGRIGEGVDVGAS
jgi:hypothetical protein